MAHSASARIGSAVIVAVVMLTLGACSSAPPEPTAAQVEATLKADIDWLMKLIHIENIKVTDGGGRDIPCGEGKMKRTYAISGVDTSSVEDPVNVFHMLTGGLGQRGYKVVSVDWKTPSNELVKGGLRVRIVVDSSRKKHFEIFGETRCLEANL